MPAGWTQSLRAQSKAVEDVTFQLEVAHVLKTFGGWNDRQRNLFLARLYRKCYMPQVGWGAPSSHPGPRPRASVLIGS